MSSGAANPTALRPISGFAARSAATGALGAAFVLLAAAVAWRRLAPPVEIVAPPALIADMVFVASGSVADGGPAGFWMDRFETTRGAFVAVLPEVAAREARIGGGVGPDDLPVARVTFAEAAAFAERVGKRLPTAAEWDLAARSTGGARFPWGDGFVPACANAVELGLLAPTRVGTFESGRTAEGIYDLHGNVSEWTSTQTSGFDRRYFVRGSSFLTSGERAAAPGERGPSYAEDSFAADLGFRCVADHDAAETDRALRRAIHRLGVRDPAGVLLQRMPAEAALRVGGPRAELLLRETARLNAGIEPVATRAALLLASFEPRS